MVCDREQKDITRESIIIDNCFRGRCYVKVRLPQKNASLHLNLFNIIKLLNDICDPLIDCLTS